MRFRRAPYGPGLGLAFGAGPSLKKGGGGGGGGGGDWPAGGERANARRSGSAAVTSSGLLALGARVTAWSCCWRPRHRGGTAGTAGGRSPGSRARPPPATALPRVNLSRLRRVTPGRSFLSRSLAPVPRRSPPGRQAWRAEGAPLKTESSLHRDQAPLADDQSPVTADAGPADYKSMARRAASASCTDSKSYCSAGDCCAGITQAAVP